MIRKRFCSSKYALKKSIEPTVVPLTAAVTGALAASSLQAVEGLAPAVNRLLSDAMHARRGYHWRRYWVGQSRRNLFVGKSSFLHQVLLRVRQT